MLLRGGPDHLALADAISASLKIFLHKAKRRWALKALFLRGVCVLGVLLVLLTSIVGPGVNAAPGQPALAESPETVAIGDVHGDFDDFVAILQHSGLIDTQHRWTGGHVTLIQVGDLLDRGPKPREVMDLLIPLQKQATQAGGRVLVLLGNHEVMNLMGDLRYVTEANFASFADAHSEQRRRSGYQEYLKWRKSHADLLGGVPDALREQSEAEWMAQHPPGFIEHREAFSPSGIYGKWLRERPAVAKIGSVIFLHGGIHPSLASLTWQRINARIHDEINAFDNTRRYLLEQRLIMPFFTLDEVTAVARAEVELLGKLSPEQRAAADKERELKLLQQFLESGSWLSVNLEGPLWFRGYDRWNEQDGAAQADKLLSALSAAHIVVGHTPQRGGRIRSRFGGKIFLIDTGMLASFYPGGRASALTILHDAKFTATYMDGQEVLLQGAALRPQRSNHLSPDVSSQADEVFTATPSESQQEIFLQQIPGLSVPHHAYMPLGKNVRPSLRPLWPP